MHLSADLFFFFIIIRLKGPSQTIFTRRRVGVIFIRSKKDRKKIDWKSEDLN